MSAQQLDTAVAVTGMSCRFPGAPDVGTFWRNLCANVDSIQRFDITELRSGGVDEALLQHPAFVPACAPIPEPYAFDAAHFGVALATARLMDLQHRAFLECAWMALEASGTLASDRREVAVFAGCSDATYPAFSKSWDDDQAGMLAASLGSSSDYLAARVAFLLNLRGPAVTVRAACATSLVAVHFAVQSLLTNECDVAVAGGAAIRHPLRRGHLHEPGGIYSHDGLCRPYDHLSSGIVSGDGVGAVVLRRFRDAVADGDYIHAIIRGSALTNDGARKASFTAPSVEGQVEAAISALGVADVDPATIGFIEGHGTATPLGDPIEVEALKRAWEIGTRGRKRCVLGSVKSCIGHLDAAAGIASLIKAVLAVEHGFIPGTVNFSTPNPNTGLADSPFLVSAKTLDWDRSGLRRASVHSLGLGGNNAHVVLEQTAPVKKTASVPMPSVPVVLTLSTKRPDTMRLYAEALATEISKGETDVSVAARTLQAGRVAEPYRRVVVGCNRKTVARALLSLQPPERQVAARPRVVLAFSGDGKRIRGALNQLGEYFPDVAATMAAAAAHLRSRWGVDLSEALLGAEPSPRGIIPAIVAQGVALHAALDRFGVGGDLVLGQSLGEITASVASGLLEFTEALDLAMAREQVFRSVIPSGALAVNMAPGSLRERLPRHLELSLINSPIRCVVSGEAAALAPFAAELEADNIPVQRLELISAVHSSLLDPVLGDFRKAAAQLKPRSPKRGLLSSLGPVRMDQSVAADPDHWTRQLREPVHFDTCMRAALSGHSETIMVDVGPTGGLSAAIQETLGGELRSIIKLLPHNAEISEVEGFALAIGRLWENGVPVNWDAWPRHATRRTSLPVPSLARTVVQPVTVAGASEHHRPRSVSLWTRNWRKAPLAVSEADQVLRIAIVEGRDHFCQSLGRWLAQSGQQVEVVAGADRADVWDRFDLVVDGRALCESDGPTAVATVLENIAQIAQQWKTSRRLVVLTRSAFDILGNETLSTSAAAVATATLVAAQECRNVELTCLDLPGGDVNADIVGRLLTSGMKPGVWLGLRERTLWQPFMEPVQRRLTPQRSSLAGGTCVIIGGLGRFGRWVGRWLAQHGYHDLFLVGRAAMTAVRCLDAVAAMRQAGARVTVVQADITNSTAIFEVLDIANRSARGPLTIFHLAGEPNAHSACAPIADLTRGDPHQALQEQWAAKMNGGLLLLDWMRRHPKSRCVAFSSNAAVLGGPGLAAYAAANAALDTLAIYARDREGLDWCSIGWDGWRLPDDEPGLMPSALEAFALRGTEPWDALQEAMARRHGHVVVAKGDFAERHRTWVEDPASAKFDQATNGSSNMDAASSQENQDLVITVRQIWSKALGFPLDADDADLFSLGGDSLTAMRIRAHIERMFGTRLTLQEVLRNRTVAVLTALLRERTCAEVKIGADRNGTPEAATAQQTICGRI